MMGHKLSGAGTSDLPSLHGDSDKIPSVAVDRRICAQFRPLTEPGDSEIGSGPRER
jgi:hypothetical protein